MDARTSFLHLPTGAPGPYEVGHVRFGDRVVGGKGVFVDDLAVLAGGGQLAPVDLECLDIGGGRQSRHPFIQGRVGIGLADQDKMEPLADEGLAQRLFAIEVIPEEGHAQRPVSRPIRGQPAFGRGVLAVLLRMAILRGDEFRLQGDDPRIARCHDHRCDRAMGRGDGAVLVVRAAAMVTVEGGRREVLGPIEGHQQLPVERAVGLQMPQLMERVQRGGEDGKHRAGRDRIEPIADVIVARDPYHPEQALGVAPSLGPLQGALEIQERRALGEEDRERPQGGIRHGIHHIRTRALIRQPLNAAAKELHKAIEGRWTQSCSKGEAHRRRKSCCPFPASYTETTTSCLLHK